jgi:hypothetical protein
MSAAAHGAAAPLPKPKRPPVPTSGSWEIDFSPLTKAGKVALEMKIVLTTGKGDSLTYYSSQRWDGNRAANGSLFIGDEDKRHGIIVAGADRMVPLATFLEELKGSMGRIGGEFAVIPRTTRLMVKSSQGRPVTSITVTLKGLDKKFTPIVLPPAKK